MWSIIITIYIGIIATESLVKMQKKRKRKKNKFQICKHLIKTVNKIIQPEPPSHKDFNYQYRKVMFTIIIMMNYWTFETTW